MNDAEKKFLEETGEAAMVKTGGREKVRWTAGTGRSLKRKAESIPMADSGMKSVEMTTARKVLRDGEGSKQANNGLLRNIDLFASLTEKELHQIRAHMVLKEFRKNQIILHEEDTSEFMYIIVQGKVKISRVGKEGKETILSIHGAGEFFGEMSLIDGKTVPATVSAVENSIVAIISKQDFYSLLYSQKKVLENLLHILCSRLRDSWKKIQMLNFNDAAQRIKMLFLILAESYGQKTENGITLRVKLIHQDMADMTGLSRETVTRVLDRWKKSGEIKILKNKFIHLYPEFESIPL